MDEQQKANQYDPAAFIRSMVEVTKIMRSPAARAWHIREQDKYPMHPAIFEAVNLSEMGSISGASVLVLEWAHTAESDSSRIAYTRSDEHGHADRQTVTSLGKYIKRHFPEMPDHTIRSITSKYGAMRFEMWDTLPQIIDSVQSGPTSCMKFTEDRLGGNAHPYSVYHPDYGWRAAVRLEGNRIMGRCIVNVNSNIFVRSYKQHDSDPTGYSYTDEALESWLESQGFEKSCSWDGKRVAFVPSRYGDEPVMPYLDGDCTNATRRGDYLIICEDGEYDCNNTSGRAHIQHRFSCDHCGDDGYEDAMYPIGENGDENVCEYCADNHYMHVTGWRGTEYRVHTDNAIYVESIGRYYHDEYLDRNDIVRLADGNYEHTDYAVYLEQAEEWVHCNDDSAVFCDLTSNYEYAGDCVLLECGSYHLRSESWLCSFSGEYYPDTLEPIHLSNINTKGIEFVHPDFDFPEVTQAETI